MKRIVIKPQAMLNMLVSATETYKQEALGVVLGKKRRKNFIIENAIPYQTSKRGFSAVTQSNKCMVVDNFLQRFLSVVGDYHTHTDFKRISPPTHMSETDKDDLQHEKVGLVIGIKKQKRNSQQPVSQRKGDGKGFSLAMNYYRYSIRGYYKNSSGKISELPIQLSLQKNASMPAWFS